MIKINITILMIDFFTLSNEIIYLSFDSDDSVEWEANMYEGQYHYHDIEVAKNESLVHSSFYNHFL
jgi:hypothetical protein